MSKSTQHDRQAVEKTEQQARQAFQPHDHAACIAQTVAAAEEKCQLERSRLTETRRKVLDLLLEEHRPMGAYAILEKLRNRGQRAQPPVAYRALDFLIENGLAHRIESLNAYVACSDPSSCNAPTFFICQQCDRIAETHLTKAQSALQEASDELGFVVEKVLREASGTCSLCREAA